MMAAPGRIKDRRFPQFAAQIGSPPARWRVRFAVPDPTRRCPPLGLANSGNKEVVMSHRLFAQLAFERALGNAAIEALATALNDKDHFDAESMWPKDPMFIGKTSADIEAVAAELRSEEHTSELQSLMRIPFAVSCL